MKKLINKIIKSNIFTNGLWMYALQIFNTIIPLLTLPYVTRVLGTSNYGVFSIALNFFGYLQVIVEYGFGMSVTRRISLSNKDSYTVNKSFSTVLGSRLFLTLVCFIFTLIYCAMNIKDITQCLCLGIMIIGIFGICMQQNYLFQGMLDMKYISLVNIISRIISIILIFTFVKTDKDILLYSLLYSISPFFSGVIGLLIARKRYNIKFVKITLSDIFNEIKDGFYVFSTQLSSKIFGAIGITFLGFFASNAEVGMYSAVQKIPSILILGWAPISQVLYPLSSKKMQKSFSNGIKFVKKVRLVVLPLFIFVSILLCLFSKQIVHIAFGSEYVNASIWLIPLLLWVIISINNNFLGSQILLASGHDKEYGKLFQIGVLFTVIINLLLIYLYGGAGASIAPALSDFILCILLNNAIKKIDSHENKNA